MLKNKISVLVVEDDKTIANAYKMKFERVGFNAKIARNGREAFNILKKFKPKVIVLDLIMPVLDGFEILRQLKVNEKYKKIPVIVASNLGGEADIKEATELGASEYIVKSQSTLNSLIEKINFLTS
jgi:two-component system alkaline phosphatase synthesis response regulator PhoP